MPVIHNFDSAALKFHPSTFIFVDNIQHQEWLVNSVHCGELDYASSSNDVVVLERGFKLRGVFSINVGE